VRLGVGCVYHLPPHFSKGWLQHLPRQWYSRPLTQTVVSSEHDLRHCPFIPFDPRMRSDSALRLEWQPFRVISKSKLLLYYHINYVMAPISESSEVAFQLSLIYFIGLRSTRRIHVEAHWQCILGLSLFRSFYRRIVHPRISGPSDRPSFICIKYRIPEKLQVDSISVESQI
jgi:hypothetical protein